MLGIVGGMGFYATNFFIQRILEIRKAKKEWENPHLLVDYNPLIPSRTRALLYGEESPTEAIIESINNLAGLGVEEIFIPCNSAHYWYDEISKKIEVPWRNLIEVTSYAAKSTSPLVIGGYAITKMKLYDEFLDAEYLSENDQKKIFNIIEMLKLGNLETAKKNFFRILESYSQEEVILACTELSMMFSFKDLEPKFLDSTTEYAKEVLFYA